MVVSFSWRRTILLGNLVYETESGKRNTQEKVGWSSFTSSPCGLIVSLQDFSSSPLCMQSLYAAQATTPLSDTTQLRPLRPCMGAAYALVVLPLRLPVPAAALPLSSLNTCCPRRGGFNHEQMWTLRSTSNSHGLSQLEQLDSRPTPRDTTHMLGFTRFLIQPSLMWLVRRTRTSPS